MLCLVQGCKMVLVCGVGSGALGIAAKKWEYQAIHLADGVECTWNE